MRNLNTIRNGLLQHAKCFQSSQVFSETMQLAVPVSESDNSSSWHKDTSLRRKNFEFKRSTFIWGESVVWPTLENFTIKKQPAKFKLFRLHLHGEKSAFFWKSYPKNLWKARNTVENKHGASKKLKFFTKCNKNGWRNKRFAVYFVIRFSNIKLLAVPVSGFRDRPGSNCDSKGQRHSATLL